MRHTSQFFSTLSPYNEECNGSFRVIQTPLKDSGRSYLVFKLHTLVSFYCKAQPISCKLTSELMNNVQNQGSSLHTTERTQAEGDTG